MKKLPYKAIFKKMIFKREKINKKMIDNKNKIV